MANVFWIEKENQLKFWVSSWLERLNLTGLSNYDWQLEYIWSSEVTYQKHWRRQRPGQF